jgi:hypothetical protein
MSPSFFTRLPGDEKERGQDGEANLPLEQPEPAADAREREEQREGLLREERAPPERRSPELPQRRRDRDDERAERDRSNGARALVLKRPIIRRYDRRP